MKRDMWDLVCDKPGTSIGACSGFEVLSKSCDQQYTNIMLLRVLLTHRVANTLGGLRAFTEEVGVLTSYRPTRIPQTR